MSFSEEYLRFLTSRLTEDGNFGSTSRARQKRCRPREVSIFPCLGMEMPGEACCDVLGSSALNILSVFSSVISLYLAACKHVTVETREISFLTIANVLFSVLKANFVVVKKICKVILFNSRFFFFIIKKRNLRGSEHAKGYFLWHEKVRSTVLKMTCRFNLYSRNI